MYEIPVHTPLTHSANADSTPPKSTKVGSANQLPLLDSDLIQMHLDHLPDQITSPWILINTQPLPVLVHYGIPLQLVVAADWSIGDA
jgi:hypothetical protein